MFFYTLEYIVMNSVEIDKTTIAGALRGPAIVA